MGTGLIVIVIGIVCMGVSAFGNFTPRVDLWKLGWALVLTGVLVLK